MNTPWKQSLVLVVALTGSPCLAAEGRTPIAVPTTITSPGQYVVTRNIASGAGTIITIDTDDVDLDLNGFLLDGSGSGASVISGTAHTGLVIRNGKLIQDFIGIRITDGKRVVIEDLQIRGNGFRGISLERTSGFAVRRNVIGSHVSEGIYVQGESGSPVSGTVEHNVIDAGGEGIRFDNTSGVGALNNRISNMNSHGIIFLFATGCLVADNTIETTVGGLRLSSAQQCTVARNVVSDSGGQIGLEVGGSDNFILENLVTKANRGIFVGGNRNHVVGNAANNNSSHGFVFNGNDHVYRGNMARGNAGANGSPPACVAQCSPDLCVYAGSVNVTSRGDNFLPGPPTFPACL